MSVFFMFEGEKYFFLSLNIIEPEWVPRKNEVDIYGPPVFPPDYCATGLAARMCTNSHDDSM